MSNHKIIVKGKCPICGKIMTDQKDNIFICYDCQLKQKEDKKCLITHVNTTGTMS